MLSTGPLSRNKDPFGESSHDLDDTGNGTGQTGSRPATVSKRLVVLELDVVLCVDGRRVIGSVEPKHGDVDDPDTVEVDSHVEPGTGFAVSLEKTLSQVTSPSFGYR